VILNFKRVCACEELSEELTEAGKAAHMPTFARHLGFNTITGWGEVGRRALTSEMGSCRAGTRATLLGDGVARAVG